MSMQAAQPGARDEPSPFLDVDVAFEELLVKVEGALQHLDPARAPALLQAMLTKQEQWAGYVDAVARHAHEHLSWAAIGRIVGVTKQAAHHRWGGNAPGQGGGMAV